MNMTTETKEAKKEEIVKTPTSQTSAHKDNAPSFRRGGRFSGKRPERRPSRRTMKERSEFDQKTIDIRRVTRVVAGGRRFSFSVALIAGNRKGSVGVGTGKAADTALAIEKAFRNAKKNMVKIKHDKNMSIPHQIEAKRGSARVIIMPAPGRGLVAGSSVRTIIDLAGLKDVGAKVISRSKNKLNIARATMKAFEKLK